MGSDGSVKVSGTSTAVISLEIMHLATNNYSGMILSGSPSGSSAVDAAIAVQYWNGGSFSSSDFETGSGLTLTQSDQIIIFVRVASGVTVNKTFYPMIRASGTDATFAPYSNICPISGHTSAVVTRTGKNLLNAHDYVSLNNCSIDANGTVTATVSDSRAFSPVLQLWLNSTFVGFGTKISNTDFRFVKDATFNRIVFGHSGATKDVKITYNAESLKDGETYIFTEDIISSTNPLSWKNMMIRPASDTDATYKPYQGQIYTISLGGTRYGGILDVGTGVLTVDRVMVTYDGSETWSISNSGMRVERQLPSGAKANTGNNSTVEGCLTNQFRQVTPNQTWSGGASGIGFSVSTNSMINVCKTGSQDMTVASWKTYLQSNPLTVVYPLATPTTVQLTAEEIKTLLGKNNIWSNTGNTNLIYESSQVDSTSNYNVGIWMNCYD